MDLLQSKQVSESDFLVDISNIFGLRIQTNQNRSEYKKKDDTESQDHFCFSQPHHLFSLLPRGISSSLISCPLFWLFLVL